MKKQKGLTLISWLAVIAVVLFNAIIAMNVVPVYMNDHSVESLMMNLETDTSIRGASPNKIKDVITKRLRINNIYDVTKDNIEIKKDRNFYIITLEYEPRGRLMGTLDYIVTFKHEVRIPTV